MKNICSLVQISELFSIQKTDMFVNLCPYIRNSGDHLRSMLYIIYCAIVQPPTSTSALVTTIIINIVIHAAYFVLFLSLSAGLLLAISYNLFQITWHIYNIFTVIV